MSIKEHIQLPDLLTMLNAAFGVMSIFFAVKRDFFIAVIFMLIAVVFDFLDGKAARMLKKTHEFGKELDSLSDVISFGVAPAVFGFIYAGYSVILTVSLVIFVLCGALRLARFNITNLKGAYEGMPITMNGVIIPLAYFALVPVSYYFVIYLLSAGLMISSIKIKKII